MAGFARTDPKSFAQLYHAVTWSLGTDNYEVEVRKYLSLNPGVCDANRIAGVKKAKSFLLRDLQKDKQAVREGNRYRITAPEHSVSLTAIDKSFAGSATPDELKQTLWLATYQGHIVPTVTTRKAETSTAEDFADWYLGMDCTGFAAAFLGFASPRSIGSYDQNTSSRRQAIKDVQSRDVMIVKKQDGEYKHIAVVVSKALQSPDIMIVHTAEASGEHMEGGWMQGVVDDKKRTLKLQSPGVFVSPAKSGAEFYFYPMP
jgi:hypothetical protein